MTPAPKETAKAVPSWVPNFLPHYLRPQQPTIRQALDAYTETLLFPEIAPSYDQVVRQLKSMTVAQTKDLLNEVRA